MNENNMPVIPDEFLMISPSSNTNDVIDLTEMNDGDDNEVTSVVASNNSVCDQQPRTRSIEHGSEIYSSTDNLSTEIRPGSADDSISILYEKIIPKPEVEVINEVANNEQNESIPSCPILRSTCAHYVRNADIPVRTGYSPIGTLRISSRPPIAMGAYDDYIFPSSLHPLRPDSEIARTSFSEPVNYSSRSTSNGYLLLPPRLSPLHEFSTSSSSSSPEPVNYSVNLHLRASQPPTFASVLALRERAIGPISVETIPNYGEPLNLEVAPVAASSNDSETPISNVPPKIQCGICLDGPDEIAASNRNFTSTNCGHVFCNTCIRTAFTNSAKCPKCRKKITAKQIHPLYL